MRHVHANGIEIACEITGAGPPIVLCHGGEADHRNFFNFAPLLAETFTVIACDQRDSGETRNGAEPYTAGDVGRDVGALIVALGYERAHVFGTSWGGVIAQEAALECPERIDRLILSATWPLGQWAVTDEFYAIVRAEKTPDEARAYRRMFFSRAFAEQFPDEAEARMQAVMITRTPDQRARRSGSNTLHDEAAARLAGLKAPTLVIAGADDRIVSPDFARRLASLIPGAQLAVLENLGHGTTMEDPAAIVAAIRPFLLAGG